MRCTVLPGMMLIGFIASASQSPAMADTIEYQCSDSLSITDDNAQVVVTGDCSEISLAGDNNVITIESVSTLNIGGDNNAISQPDGTTSASTEIWIGGDNNTLALNSTTKIILAGDNNQVSYKDGDQIEPVMMGDNNAVTVGQGGSTVPSEPSFSKEGEAEKEAILKMVNESAPSAGGTLSQEAVQGNAEEITQETAGESAASAREAESAAVDDAAETADDAKEAAEDAAEAAEDAKEAAEDAAQ